MSGIDETSGAGQSGRSERTEATESAGEAEETGGGDQTSGSQSATSGQIPDKSSSYEKWRSTLYGSARDGAPRPMDGETADVTPAMMLQAERAAGRSDMAERKQQLGEALDTQHEEMAVDWEADSGLVVDKWASAWQDEYSDRASSTDDARISRQRIEEALYQSGRVMSDDDIEEVVAEHRDRLEKKGAFEGWGTDDIHEWQEGVTAFLKHQRAEQPVRQFEPPSIDDLPTPSRDLEERSIENPNRIRRKVREWEAEQLAQLEEAAEKGGLEKGGGWAAFTSSAGYGANDAYKAKRDRIREAADAYINITVGDGDGNKYAYREEVDIEETHVRPRDAYLRHLEEHPGDIMGAFSNAEQRVRDANREELMYNLANAAG